MSNRVLRLMVATTALALLTIVPPAAATTYVVRPDGSGDFPTIQAALDACVNGDIVELADGVFTGPGNVDISNGEVVATIRSQSGEAAVCVIACEGSAAAPHRFITLTTGGENSTEIWGLYDLTITGGYAYSGGAVQVLNYAWPQIHGCVLRENRAEHVGGAIYTCNGNPSIAGCQFEGNVAERGGAVGGIGESACHLEGCTFRDNEADVGGALYVDLDNGTVIAGCTFVRNSAPTGAALRLQPYHYAIPLTRCLMAFNLGGAGVAVTGGQVDLACCDIFANDGGDWVGEIADQLGLAGNIALDPLFCGLDQDNLYLHENSPCAPGTECDQIGAWPVGCGPVGTTARTWSDLKTGFR